MLDDLITDQNAVYPQRWQPGYRSALIELRQYEGWRAYFPAATGALLSAIALLVPLVVLAVGVFVIDGKLATYLVGLVSLATAGIPTWALKSRLWARLTLDRWSVRHAFDPAVPRVTVNVREIDAAHTGAAVRAAGLILEYARISYGGEDPKNFHIAVAQWAHAPQMEEGAFRDNVRVVFETAGIWANVAGIEVNAPLS